MRDIDKLDIDLFKNVSENDIEKSINEVFSKILFKIRSYLNLKPISSTVEFIYKKNDSKTISKAQNIFDLGTNRYFVNDALYIEIFEEYKKFLPFILLREVYNCFVPINLRKNDAVNIFINQIVENDLSELDVIKEWKSLVRSKIINIEFLSSYFDRLEKFLELNGVETTESPVNIFFEHIRRNLLTIDDREKDLYDMIFKKFVFKLTKSLKNDEMIETLRILIEIFYKVKSYRALLEYEDYFKKFKDNGTIQTDLSLNKFIAKVRWINNFSYIGPSYHVNWKAIDVAIIDCTMKFNPLLTKTKIDLVVEKFPFFIWSIYSLDSFAVEVSGWFVVPRIYLKDLFNFIEKLEQFRYILNVTYIILDNLENNLNLNYLREFYKKGRIINPDHKKYDKKYEITFELDCGKDFHKQELSVLEFLVLDRVRNWSITGFGFQRREETLRSLKSDLFNEIFSQRVQIIELKKNFNAFHEDQDLTASFLRFLDEHQKYGFFRVKDLLENLLSSVNLIEKCLIENSNVKDIYQLQELVNKQGVSRKLDDNVLLSDKDIKKILFRNLIQIYFQNKKTFNEEVRRYRAFYDTFTSCYNLKIFGFNTIKRILQDKTIVEKIYSKKENKLKRVYESLTFKIVTLSDVEDILDKFVNASQPIIKPILISTINTTGLAPFFLLIILKNIPETQKILDKLKIYFPRFIIIKGINLFKEEGLIFVECYLPVISNKEKDLFFSIFRALFKDKLLSIKPFFWDGFHKAYSRKDFYDFERKEFFYTKDLFQQFFIYVQTIFGKEFKETPKSNIIPYNSFLPNENNMESLIYTIETRISTERIDLDINNLKELLNFHLNLRNILLDINQFNEIKKNLFFKNYIKSLKFKPCFPAFGLGEYFLFVRPIDSSQVDFKLLLANTFLSVKYPACVDESRAYLIKYLFPYKNPNMNYLNWLSKSKKNIHEYCYFLVKKVHQLFQFDTNIGPNGWELAPDRFKTYVQNVLFDPNFSVQFPGAKEFSIGEWPVSEIWGPESLYFEYLTKIYSWKPLNIKTILGAKNRAIFEAVTELTRKNLIFPNIKLKNLDLNNKIWILLPNLKKESITKIIKIFSFFNYGFVYEIEGELFINGKPPLSQKFENGLFVKLYLPRFTDFSEFYKLFNKIFRYLQIKRFLIFDLIDGSNTIKATFENLNFLNSYNPLKNLKWNNDDKIWMNHKPFNEKFEPIYPNLTIKENKELS